METKIDRVARRLRPFLIGAIYLAAPVSCFAYAKMLLLAYSAWHPVVFLLAFVAQLIAVLGVASLFDSRQ
jgi:CHASE2 domain-containing sensor protein